METIGDRKYVQIPGDKVYELPPLLLKEPRAKALADVVGRAESIVDDDWLLAEPLAPDAKTAHALEIRRAGLAVNLAEQYARFLAHWIWGESVLEWIRQCEITFETRPTLRPLLKPDVWPHASRASFVTLLEDKRAPAEDVDLEKAMGYRLTFRKPPPIQFLSDKFLFFLNATLAAGAYRAWADTAAGEGASLPPERFRFFVAAPEIREV
jgi:hypothetical protein